jgi:polar amino acid transport system substrate-binding protein
MHKITSIAVAAMLVLVARFAAADTLDDIQKRGTLRWGGDASAGGPYIYPDRNNKQTGFEFDLAEYLAAQIGVRAEFVNGEWEMLPQQLDRGDIDVVINGYEWSQERDQSWSSTIPYYIYKLQLMTRKNDATIHSWDDLRGAPGKAGKSVGVLRDSAAQRYVARRFGGTIELKAFPEMINVLGMVEQGRLDATIQDLPVANYYGKDFPGLHKVGVPEAPGYYVALVRKGDERIRLRLNEGILLAMKNGTMEKIYEKHGVWNDDQKQLPDVVKNWPPVVEEETSRWTGFQHGVWLLILASWTTIKLSFASMPLAILIGLLVAVGRLYGPRWLGLLLETYVEFLRGTPLLLQLFVIYYVLPQFIGLKIPAFAAGVLGLAINYSAYEAENYRAGLLAIPRGQLEAALSLGMSTRTALHRVIVPQAMRIVIPPVTNDFIALFKDTSVCSMISVIELTGMYRTLFSDHPRLLIEFGMITALLYLVMSYPLSLVARRMETRFKKVTA